MSDQVAGNPKGVNIFYHYLTNIGPFMTHFLKTLLNAKDCKSARSYDAAMTLLGLNE